MTADDFIEELTVEHDKEEICSITQQNLLLVDTLATFEEQEDRFKQVVKHLEEVPDQDVFDRKLVKDSQEELSAQISDAEKEEEGQFFIKCADIKKKQFAIDIKIARSGAAFGKLIADLLCGTYLPSNAVIEVYRNGYVLRDLQKVQQGDTLLLSVLRHGLCGGSSSVHPDNTQNETVTDLI